MPDDTVDARSQQRVVAAVITRGDRMLVSRRPVYKRHGGMWEFPGGKVGEGESDVDAISRELHEELDVRAVRVGEPDVAIADPGSPFVIVFVPVEIEGEPRCIEHTEHRWGTLEELLEMELAPSDRAFVAGKARRG